MNEKVFLAALQGIISNPTFFGAFMQGNAQAAIDFARDCAGKCESPWMPITDAQKIDAAAPILVCDDRAMDGDIHLVNWNSYSSRWDRVGSTKFDWYERIDPTHWMPVPATPKRSYE